jgi:hypothetical protein
LQAKPLEGREQRAVVGRFAGVNKPAGELEDISELPARLSYAGRMNERRARELGRIRRAWSILAIAGLVVAVAIAARGRTERGGHDAEARTSMRVQVFAHDWFPRWMLKAEKACADSLLEVGRAVDPAIQEEDTEDMWGQPLVMLCGDQLPAGARGLAVYSIGQNGIDERGSGDDITSWGR